MNDNIKSPDPINGINIYEVNIRQYTKEGTFNAFIQHLPRLKDMGVKTLWIMPITPISKEKRQGTLGSYYACSDYTSINPEFGSLEDFKQLIKQAHALDLKVIIDWVANHTGWDHVWTREHTDWYEKDPLGNFIERHGWVDVIDLDYTNNNMRAAMINCMKYWINECDTDGFRCDMAHLVPLDFWIEAKQHCEEKKSLFWLAECEVPEYHEVFNVSYAWKWMHSTEKIAQGAAPLEEMKEILNSYEKNYPAGARKLFFTANHDENTWNGTEYEKYGDGAKAFAVFTFLWPGVPLIYSGQELPNYRRLHFFEKDQIDWTPSAPQLHGFYKKLLQLASENQALHNLSNVTILPTEQDNYILAFMRITANNKVIAIFNFSSFNRLHFTITHPELAGNYTHLFSGINYQIDTTQPFELQAWEFIIMSSEKDN